jgi:3-deoxy-D-manno-oct-2-ulosonic acid (Kdo) hydroxylase
MEIRRAKVGKFFMSQVIVINDRVKWFEPSNKSWVCELEEGNLIYLPKLGFILSQPERLLLHSSFSLSAKNVSFDTRKQTLKGASLSAAHTYLLKGLLTRFSQNAQQLIETLFPIYKTRLILGKTSFRPLEVKNRNLSRNKDDRLLHVDAFPSQPNQGKRILRVFTNINPQENRVWRIGEDFTSVAKRFLPTVPKQIPGIATVLHLLGITKSYRTQYDHVMLHIHNRMKHDQAYQEEVKATELQFPSQTSWIVATDQVSHAALSGRYVLEQTFLLPVEAMMDPSRSPLKILEKLAGKPLIPVSS